jgi:hypothetical protein
MKHYEFEISQFIDGELTAGEKKELFLHLSECSECQKVFSEYLTLKEKSKDFCAGKIAGHMKENMSIPLDDVYSKIAPVIPIVEKKKVNIFYKSAFYITTAAAALLLLFIITRKPYTEIVTKTESKIDTVFVANQKTPAKIPGFKSTGTPERSDKEYLKYVLGLRSDKIRESEVIEVVKGENK